MYRLLILAATALLAAAQPQDRAPSVIAEMSRLSSEGNSPASKAMESTALQLAGQLGPTHPDLVPLLNQVALSQQLSGQYLQAEKTYRRAIRVLEGQAPAPAVMANLLLNSATLYLEARDRPGHAEVLARRALKLATEAHGAQSPVLGKYLLAIGASRLQQGDIAAARRFHEQALEVEDDKILRAVIWQHLAAVAILERHWSTAERYLADAIAVHLELQGPVHLGLIQPYMDLAAMYSKRRQWAQAAESIEKARAIAELTLGPNHPVMGEILSASANVARKTGHRKLASDLDRRAAAIESAQKGGLSFGSVHVADLANPNRK